MSTMKEPTIPKARFTFGQKVRVNWRDPKIQPSLARVTGVAFNPREDPNVVYILSLINRAKDRVSFCPTYDVYEDMLEAIDER